MKPTPFEWLAGASAILAGAVGLLYSVSFVILRNDLLSALFLMLGGLLSLVALFNHLSEVNPGVAIVGLILGSAGALGAAVHGSYDLANAINPPSANALALADLPSQIDPRGFLTFGAAGLALFVAAYLIGHDARMPRHLAPLTYMLAVLLLIVYLGRLIVLNPTSPLILLPVALTGFIVNPLWYVLLGLALHQGQRQWPPNKYMHEIARYRHLSDRMKNA